MFSKACVSNGLDSDGVAVWSKLSPGISPSEWASLCRQVGSLSPGEFSTIVSLVNAHQRIKTIIKRQVEGMLEQSHAEKMPLVSAGPSGIGGEYQTEIFLNPAKVEVKRQKLSMPFAQIVKNNVL